MTAEARVDAWAGRDLVFVSYSRDDAEWMQAFRVMLEPVLDEFGVRLWVDTDIRTGDDWTLEIEQAIARSGVALVLVSGRFLASSYIRRHELPALRAHGVPAATDRCRTTRKTSTRPTPASVVPETYKQEHTCQTARDDTSRSR